MGLFFWNKILLPLLLVLALLVIVGIILYIYGIVVNIVSLMVAQHKMRRTLKKQLKRCCAELERAVTKAFEPALNSMTDNSDIVEQQSDENGDYVILTDDNGKQEKRYVRDILNETFGEEFVKLYDENKKKDNK